MCDFHGIRSFDGTRLGLVLLDVFLQPVVCVHSPEQIPLENLGDDRVDAEAEQVLEAVHGLYHKLIVSDGAVRDREEEFFLFLLSLSFLILAFLFLVLLWSSLLLFSPCLLSITTVPKMANQLFDLTLVPSTVQKLNRGLISLLFQILSLHSFHL